MTKQERKMLEMVYSGVLKIDKLGLIWKCQKKHKEWEGYKKCIPRLLGHSKKGYIRIVTRDEGGNTLRAYAHRIVFMYHYGDIPENLQINHENGLKHDNRLENLELMTSSQQMIHAVTVLGRQVGNRTKGRDRRGSRLGIPNRGKI